MIEEARPETILITGATGFIGKHLAKRLVEQGYTPRLLVRDTKRLNPYLREHCQVIVGDLLDCDSLCNAVRETTIIFHCAANVATWGNWQDYQRPNVDGVQNLLESIVKSNTKLPRLIHLSTADVYGFPQKPSEEEAPLSDAGFYYAKSKIQAEALIRTYGAEHQLPFCIVRPCNVIGTGSPFIKRIGDALTRGVMISIDGGRAHAGLIDVENLVNALCKLAVDNRSVGETLNLRDQYDLTWNEFLKQYKDALKGRGIIIDLPFKTAVALSKTITRLWRFLGLRSEPLLHPLIVHIFGRTCGHSIRKAEDHLGEFSHRSFETSLCESATAYQGQKKSN